MPLTLRSSPRGVVGSDPFTPGRWQEALLRGAGCELALASAAVSGLSWTVPVSLSCGTSPWCGWAGDMLSAAASCGLCPLSNGYREAGCAVLHLYMKP